MEYPNLFSSVEIRGHRYRNRILTGPTMFAEFIFNPEMSENIYRMCERRAKGGAAEVSTGELTLNEFNAETLFAVEIDIDARYGRVFDGFCQYAERIKRHGAVALLELCHPGAGDIAEYDEQKMSNLCDVSRRGASFARAAGFDGILLHGGHGFMIQKFASPHFNRRTDEYGGDVKNRARFPIRILDSFREGLGEDGILEMRISAQDGIPGGMLIEDLAEFCRVIDGKADIIHVSNGLKYAGNRTHTFTSMYDEHGYNIPFAARIKQAVKQSKVAVIGGINDPAMCEEAIRTEKTDFVVLSRQAIADPEFPNKAQEGRSDMIRRCLRCFHCYPGPHEHETEEFWSPATGIGQKAAGAPHNMPGPGPKPPLAPCADSDPLSSMLASIRGGGIMAGECTVNPTACFKMYPERFRTPKGSRKVLVIGGGPAGMQAAVTAAERGHSVTLAEKAPVLGGILVFTDNDSDKKDLNSFKEVMKREIDQAGITVLTNCAVDGNMIRSGGYEHVIIATGAAEKPCGIKGAENSISVLEALLHRESLGESIAVIGSGLSGCEAAVTLAGEGHRVSLISRRDKLAPGSVGMQRTSMLDEMDNRCVKQYLKHSVREIYPDGVLLETSAGNPVRIYADAVVTATGMEIDRRSLNDLIAACKGSGIPYSTAGDCNTIGTVCTAVRDGYISAMLIE